MSNILRQVIIVGGGSAGWLTAGVIAAEHQAENSEGIEVTLVESTEIAPIGVGEGTWPSMRNTLKKMGISETEFLLHCDASFKQGSKFNAWQLGNKEFYYHPFSLPKGHNDLDLAPYWQAQKDQISFTDAVCVQGYLGDKNLAPKQITTAEYAFNANYGYHLDAGKFSAFLKKHCIEKLGVKHVVDHVTTVNSAKNGDIASISTKQHGQISGDLFIDCSGVASLLLGKHFNIPFISKKDVLFNDSALAVHVPYQSENDPIASFTFSTAQTAGWVWDIGLPSRRGVGHTYSSDHISDDMAERQLRDYILPSMGKSASEAASIRKISLNPGHREKFWHKNCVAIGVSAGFIEPLEASALALIELSAKMLSDNLPANRQIMDIVAKRFNEKFQYRWQRIIEFLKLHYVLSQRTDSAYWLDNRELKHIPESLQEMLSFWKFHVPGQYDLTQTEELFPYASFQYVLYGMGFTTESISRPKRVDQRVKAEKLLNENIQHSKQLMAVLPTNRQLINTIRQYSSTKI